MSKSKIYYGAVNQQLLEVLTQENYTKLFVLVDENTKTHCLPLLNLPKHQLIEIESGEKHKNLQTCQVIWAKLMGLKADRNSLLINLGGGVIGDMGGFCAASFKRGMRFINIPTTLLAMVDASLGGKTGVDFMNQKNMIGLFASPLATFIDPLFLDTLSKRQVKSGQAEMIKHGLIASQSHFEKTIGAQEFPLALIRESVEIKQHIVNQDPFEKNIRKSLNFGHTLGHAIESAALSEGKDLLHGEAIAQGMILAIRLSISENLLDPLTGLSIIKQIENLYEKPSYTQADLSMLLALAKNDKKNIGEQMQYTLLESVGQVVFDVTISPKKVIQLLALPY